MNERIKYLAKQSGLSYLYDYDADGHAMVCSESDIKKFAELVVRECISKCEFYNDSNWGTASECIAQDIKQHFGVEE